MNQDKKDNIKKDEEEREAILEYLRMQNEALKRIYKYTIEKEEEK